MRVLLWVNLVAWTGITVWAVIAHPIFAPPSALLAAAQLAGLFPDVLRDHPDERPFTEKDKRESMELMRAVSIEDRRRRGLAGWQKPVKPTQQVRPGGLPPKPRG